MDTGGGSTFLFLEQGCDILSLLGGIHLGEGIVGFIIFIKLSAN
jgi:hypothetical protein